jgi:hypothetical protein
LETPFVLLVLSKRMNNNRICLIVCESSNHSPLINSGPIYNCGDKYRCKQCLGNMGMKCIRIVKCESSSHLSLYDNKPIFNCGDKIRCEQCLYAWIQTLKENEEIKNKILMKEIENLNKEIEKIKIKLDHKNASDASRIICQSSNHKPEYDNLTLYKCGEKIRCKHCKMIYDKINMNN